MKARTMLLGPALVLLATTVQAGPLGPTKASQAVRLRGTTTSFRCEPGDLEFTTRNPNQILDILPGQVLVLTGVNAQINVSPPPSTSITYVLRLYEQLGAGGSHLNFVPVPVTAGAGAATVTFPPIVVTPGYTVCMDAWTPTTGVTISFANVYGFIAADR